MRPAIIVGGIEENFNYFGLPDISRGYFPINNFVFEGDFLRKINW